MVAEEQADYSKMTQIHADENLQNNLRPSVKSADKISWRFVSAENPPRQNSDVLQEDQCN